MKCGIDGIEFFLWDRRSGAKIVWDLCGMRECGVKICGIAGSEPRTSVGEMVLLNLLSLMFDEICGDRHYFQK